MEWLTSPDLLRLVGLVAGLLLARLFGGRLIEKVVRQVIRGKSGDSAQAEKAREDTLISILRAILRVVIWSTGIILVLTQLGVNLGPLIIGTSIVGVGIGFGTQTIVRDFVSGIFIILENQYRIGDTITVCNITGTVEAISVRQTILRSVDGTKHYIPNGQIKTTSNQTMGQAKLNLKFQLNHHTDLKRCQQVVDRVGQQLAKDEQFAPLIKQAPKFLRLGRITLEGLEIVVVGQVKVGQQWHVAGELRQRLLVAFKQAEIPLATYSSCPCPKA